jgi:hypothetical protein
MVAMALPEVLVAKTTGGRQTSNKSGVASTSEKMDNSRHGFKTQPAARKVAGAFAEEKGSAPMKRKSGTASTRAGKASALRQVKSR